MWKVYLAAVASLAAMCGDTGYDCGDYGTCQSVGSVYRCICRPGWTGYRCDQCAKGYAPIGGRCVAPECIEDGLECGGRGSCLYRADTKKWYCGNCPSGFFLHNQTCVSSRCYNGNVTNTTSAPPPCNEHGLCEFVGGSASERSDYTKYVCACTMIYSGQYCDACDETYGKLVSGSCVARSCYDGEDMAPCQGRGTCIADFQLHPITGKPTLGYICRCAYLYTLVGTAKCVPFSCIFEQMGQNTECGAGGRCVANNSGFACECGTGFIRADDGSCTAQACIPKTGSNTKPCSGNGACVSNQDFTDSETYYCNCPTYTGGDFCEVCEDPLGTMLNGRCVALACVHNRVLCSNHGECVLDGQYQYKCQCTGGYEASGTNMCIRPDCLDSVLNRECSGAGTCERSGDGFRCRCNDQFTLADGRCIPTKLISNGVVCSNKGTATLTSLEDAGLNPVDPNSWFCQCHSAFRGTLCSDCNTAGNKPEAYMIGNVCVPVSCISFVGEQGPRAPTMCNAIDSFYCKQAGTGYDSIFYCHSDTRTDYLVAYNMAMVVTRACAYPAVTQPPLNLYCGMLENRTISPYDPDAPFCGGDECSCPSTHNLVKRRDAAASTTGQTKYFTACIHKDCLNKDLVNETSESVLSDPSSYCNGLGDCLKVTSTMYRCFCAKGSTLFNSTCVPNECLSTDPETDLLVVCGGRGSCSVGSSGAGVCNCDSEDFIGFGGSCFPRACSYMDVLTRTATLCGGLGRGMCIVNDVHPALSTCECKAGFILIGTGYCAPSGCTAYGADQPDIVPDMQYVCSGIGECIANEATGRYNCKCPEDVYSEGPYCLAPSCMVQTGLIEIGPGSWKNFVLECGFAGAGTCVDSACVCNQGYKKDIISGRCVHVGCIDSNGQYCGADPFAKCVNNNDGTGYSCNCGYTHASINGTCQPFQCVSPDYSGKATLCSNRGKCIILNDKGLCSCDNNLIPVEVSTEHGRAYACPHPDCYDMTLGSDNARVCSGRGTCKETATKGVCVCNAGYLLVGTGICEHEECVQVDGNGVASVCGGVGSCVAIGESIKCACNNGFSLVDSKCVASACITTESDGETTECSGTGLCTLVGSVYKCVCKPGYQLVTSSNSCISEACVSTFQNESYECGGKGQCQYVESGNETPGSFSCACNAGYETVVEDNPIRAMTHLCVARSCVATDSNGVSRVCNGGGICSPTNGACLCSKGYAGAVCDKCADGYERPPDGYVLSMCLETTCADKSCGGAGLCVPSLIERKMICQCSDYHYDLSGRCVPCIISNCEECDVSVVAKQCARCQDGYYLSADKTECLRCHRDCKTCTDGGSEGCLSCVDGKVHKRNGQDAAGCKNQCVVGTDGCIECGSLIDNTKYCSRCLSSMEVPINGECVSQIGRAAACLSYTNGECKLCASGYFIFQNGCYSTYMLPGKSVCAIASGGKCTICKSGYGLANSECSPCSAENCLSCSKTPSQCTRCRPGWFLANGQCQKCTDNCVSCDQGGKDECYACGNKYFTSYIFSDAPSGECRLCSDTTAVNGIAGVAGCSYCVLPLTNGTAGNPERVICLDEFWPADDGSGARLSKGGIIGIVVTVLLIFGGGVAGVLVWLFVFKRGKSLSRSKRYHLTEASTSLLSQDYTSSML